MVGKKRENKAIGLTKGCLNTKIHAIVDGVGNSVAFLLSLGNDGDSTHAIELMKLFRRVATRYDKLDKSFLAFVYMAATMIWLL